jgi:hypothetical protein
MPGLQKPISMDASRAGFSGRSRTPRGHPPWEGLRRAGVLALAAGFCIAIALLTVVPATVGPRVIAVHNAKPALLAPEQGDQLYTFTACASPDGSSCLSPYGGIDTPLDVGTRVSLEFFTSIFCTTPITGTVDWGDSSAVQSQQISSGNCQCMFGPFAHTYNSAGNFPLTVSDTCDGSESGGTISVSNSLSTVLFSPSGLAASFGAILGFAGLLAALVSFRGPRGRPGPRVLTPVQVPATVGFHTNSPTGQDGVATSTTVPMPNAPPAAPPWAFDYRTAPYSPSAGVTQGWGEARARFNWRSGGQYPAPPSWPPNNNPPPPTGFPGVYYQPRINPQTAQWAWWNPVDGTFLPVG